MPIRRILAVFAVALAVAWAGYSAYWFHAQGLLRKGVERWADERRAEGWQVRWADMQGGGYPAHLRLDLEAPEIVTPSGMAWRTGHLTAIADPLQWTALHLEAPGQHALDWPGGSLRLDAGMARADVNLDHRGGLADSTLLASDLSIDGLAAEPVTLAGLALTWDPLPSDPPQAAGTDHTQASARFSATGHGIRLPALPFLPLDRDVTLAEVTGKVMGHLPAGPPARSLAAWAADGGTLELEHVSLDWAPMALEGDGTVALDPAGQPLAAMSAQVRGLGPLMDRLADSRAMEPSAAQAAKMILLMMAKPDAKGRPAVSVPISLQDGVLSLGPAPVARFPAVQWGW